MYKTYFFSKPNGRERGHTHPAIVGIRTEGASRSWAEWQECEAEHSYPYSASGKKEWSYTSALLVCPHGEYKDNFIRPSGSTQQTFTVFSKTNLWGNIIVCLFTLVKDFKKEENSSEFVIIIIFFHGLGRLTCSGIDALLSFPGAQNLNTK